MGPERELRVRAVTLATVTLLLEDDDDKRFLSSDSKEVFECLLLNSRRPPRRTEVPRIRGYAETVVPQYSLSDFHQHFRMSRGTFELRQELSVDAANQLQWWATSSHSIKAMARRLCQNEF